MSSTRALPKIGIQQPAMHTQLGQVTQYDRNNGKSPKSIYRVVSGADHQQAKAVLYEG